MKRRFFNLLATASLLIALPTSVDWVRGYWRYDSIHWIGARTQWIAAGSRGWISLTHSSLKGGRYDIYDVPAGFHADTDLPHPFQTNLQPSGYKFYQSFGGITVLANTMPYQLSDPSRGIESWQAVALPSWLVLLASSILPVRWFYLRLKIRVATSSPSAIPCPTCGYDLRATPNRCPECGTPVNTSPR